MSDPSVPGVEPLFSDDCRVCGAFIGWISCPTGGWWAHRDHPSDDHDAVPVGDENGCYTLPDGDCVGACTLHRTSPYSDDIAVGDQ